jgi:hypothetical protein
MGAPMRFRMGLPGGGSEMTIGRVVGYPNDGSSLDLQLPDGSVVRVPANKTEGAKAMLPDTALPDGVDSDGPDDAITSDFETVVPEMVGAPAGWRKDESASSDGIDVFTDDEYTITRYSKIDKELGARVNKAGGVNQKNPGTFDLRGGGADPSGKWNKDLPLYEIRSTDGSKRVVGYAQDWADTLGIVEDNSVAADAKKAADADAKAKAEIDDAATAEKVAAWSKKRQAEYDKHVYTRTADLEDQVSRGVDAFGRSVPDNWTAEFPETADSPRKLDAPGSAEERSQWQAEQSGPAAAPSFDRKSTEFIDDIEYTTDLNGDVIRVKQNKGMLEVEGRSFYNWDGVQAALPDIAQERYDKSRERMADALDKVGVDSSIVDMVRNGESRDTISEALSDDEVWSDAQNDLATSGDVDLPQKFQKDRWDATREANDALNRLKDRPEKPEPGASLDGEESVLENHRDIYEGDKVLGKDGEWRTVKTKTSFYDDDNGFGPNSKGRTDITYTDGSTESFLHSDADTKYSVIHSEKNAKFLDTVRKPSSAGDGEDSWPEVQAPYVPDSKSNMPDGTPQPLSHRNFFEDDWVNGDDGKWRKIKSVKRFYDDANGFKPSSTGRTDVVYTDGSTQSFPHSDTSKEYDVIRDPKNAKLPVIPPGKPVESKSTTPEPELIPEPEAQEAPSAEPVVPEGEPELLSHRNINEGDWVRQENGEWRQVTRVERFYDDVNGFKPNSTGRTDVYYKGGLVQSFPHSDTSQEYEIVRDPKNAKLPIIPTGKSAPAVPSAPEGTPEMVSHRRIAEGDWVKGSDSKWRRVKSMNKFFDEQNGYGPNSKGRTDVTYDDGSTQSFRHAEADEEYEVVQAAKPAAPQAAPAPTVETELEPVAIIEEPEAATDSFDFPNVPDGAYKMNLDFFEPEGRVDEDSADYTDDPRVLAQKFSEEQLTEALAEALVNDKSFADSFLEQLDDEPSDDDEDAPKPKKSKPGPKPKKKVNNTATGSGKLAFDGGDEYVPAEALYLALQERGVDIDGLVADMYDSRAGDSQNRDALNESRGEGDSAPLAEIREQEPEVVADELDEILEEESVEEAEPDVYVSQRQLEKLNIAAEISAIDVDELQPGVRELRDFTMQLPIPADESEAGANRAAIAEFLAPALAGVMSDTASDSDKALIASWWGLFQHIDNGDGGVVSTGLREVAKALADYSGIDDSDYNAVSALASEIYKQLGSIDDFKESKSAFAAGEEGSEIYRAFAEILAAGASANQRPVFRGVDMSIFDEDFELYTTEGSVINFAPSSWTWEESTADSYAKRNFKSDDNTAGVVFRLDAGEATSMNIERLSWFFHEHEDVVWGQYVVDSVTKETAPTYGGETKDTYVVNLRPMTTPEWARYNANGDYSSLLSENEYVEMPEGYHDVSPDAYEPEYPEGDNYEGVPEGFTDSPLYLAEMWETNDLIEQLRAGVEDGTGFGSFEYPLDEGYTAQIPVEAIRDALQIQGFDTDEILRDVANAGDGVDADTETDEPDIEPAESIAADEIAAVRDETALSEFDISDWKQVGGQMGSNKGGTYEDADGNRYYVKYPKSDLHAQNETLASALYRAAGVDAAGIYLGRDGNGDLVTVSPMIDGATSDFGSRLDEQDYLEKVQDGFAVDAWLANWDVAGLVFDNVVTDADGNPVRVDPGGALIFRAQGAPKGGAFGNEVTELDTLRDQNKNAQSFAVFGSMSTDQLRESARKLLPMTPDKIEDMVGAIVQDPEQAKELSDKLKARRQYILDYVSLNDEQPETHVNTYVDDEKETPAGVATPEPAGVPDDYTPPAATVDEPSPEPEPTPPTDAYLSSDGTPLQIGMKVRSTKDGLEAEVVKFDKNPKYVFVKDASGKKIVRSTKTLEILTDSDESPASEPEAPEAPEAPSAGEPEDTSTFQSKIDALMALEPVLQGGVGVDAIADALGIEPAVDMYNYLRLRHPAYYDKNPQSVFIPSALLPAIRDGLTSDGRDDIDAIVSDVVLNGPKAAYEYERMPISAAYADIAESLADGENGKYSNADIFDLAKDQRWNIYEAMYSGDSVVDIAPPGGYETPISVSALISVLEDKGWSVPEPKDNAPTMPTPAAPEPAAAEPAVPEAPATPNLESPEEAKARWDADGDSNYVEATKYLESEGWEWREFPNYYALIPPGAEGAKDAPVVVFRDGDFDTDDVELENILETIDKLDTAPDVEETPEPEPAASEPPAADSLDLKLPKMETPGSVVKSVSKSALEAIDYSGTVGDGIEYSIKGDLVSDYNAWGKYDGKVAGVTLTVKGKTFPIKDALKKAGYRYNGDDKSWSIALKPGMGVGTLDDALASIYGGLEKIGPVSGEHYTSFKDDNNDSEPEADVSEPEAAPAAAETADIPTPPPGAPTLPDANGNPIWVGAKVTDAQGNEGTVVKLQPNGTYVDVKFPDETKKARSVKKVVVSGTGDMPVAKSNTPKKSSKPIQTGAPAVVVDEPQSWNQSNFEDVKSMSGAIDYVRQDADSATRGASVATDAGDVEDLDVRVTRVLDQGGDEKLMLKYRLTSWAGAVLAKKVFGDPDVKSTELRIRKLRRDQDGLMRIAPDSAYKNGYGRTYEFTVDTDSGPATVILHRANTSDGANPSSSGPKAFHNLVQVVLPGNATEDDIAKVMTAAGVRDARPAVQEDARVLIENRVLSLFGKKTNPTKNLSGPPREAKLEEIYKKWGFALEDVRVVSGADGRIEYRLPPEVAEKIAKATGVKAILHSITPPSETATGKLLYSGPEDERRAAWLEYYLELFGSPHDGLLSTTSRWTEGIGRNGMSSTSDAVTGGADYVFTAPKGYRPDTTVYSDSYNSRPRIVFRPEAVFERLDMYANKSDKFGKRSNTADIIKNITPYTYELMLKHRLGWSDLDHVLIPEARMRDDLIAALKARGIFSLGGIPIEQIFISKGEALPDISPEERAKLKAAMDKIS